ncbi:amidohydrolase family protein [Ramlibacter sp. G-1-2-2]|uniref:Amidohydrolase family protein n=1 Tax=Ramlibacter agri TaxID=2728837 RepID=A0A848GXW3_9BURK|nr:amidohydrolase family protein [Ramlibacter agri]NML42261.1 amidohydrolase family protein [Ramlibacter agri]
MTGAAAAAPHRFGGIQADRPDYLARQPEEPVLEPGLPIVDAHHHLWDIKGAADPRLGGISHRYLVDEYAADAASGHNIEATVFVECRAMYRSQGPVQLRPVGEVEFAAGMGAMADSGSYGPTRIASVVMGQANLSLGADVREVLEACVLAGAGRFRGVRHSAGWANVPGVRNNATSTGPELYRSAAFQAGARCLTEMGLALDLFLFHHQLEDVAILARAIPDARLALCHCGGPLGFDASREHQQAVFDAWLRNIRAVAACDNVRIKLGGIMNRLGAFDFRTAPRPPSSEELAALWRPYIETCIELFGARRCMFESNFPVEKMGISFKALWNAFKRITAGCSDAEKALLYSGTARSFYRIP